MVALPPEARQQELEAAQAALLERLRRDIDYIRMQVEQPFIRQSIAVTNTTSDGIPEYLRLRMEEARKDDDTYDQYVRDAVMHNHHAHRFKLQMDSPFASLPTLCRRFTLIELLGVSSSGIEVWKAMDLHLTKDVTLKVSADTHMITYDYKALAKIDVHDAVVGMSRDGLLHDTFQGQRYSMYALQFMQDDLQSILHRRRDGRLPPVVAHAVAFQVAKCIQHLCIDARVAHCDLRPSNILVTRPWNVAVTNFKSSRSRRELLPTIPHHKVKEMDASSVLYAAPETFNCLEALGNTVTCDATDVWALGVLYFVMLYGHHPLAPGLVVLDDAMKLPFVEHLRKYDGTVVFPATPVVPPIVQVRVLVDMLKC
ncbi:serine/threonine protein kinase, variant 1 [Aphanomyces astaci]|uniref:Serine/threonine protein kinase, variant 1 n=1 Tax=Aphanomyces astaci TaxID=112090 RepID=W4GSA2_APHAT|nr:serine/threonine protein kinase, variant 1 [Aphanomyces astaci]ETV82557.1 serine/threonine protein kinase, variant 1 [Aphanomyces astaci]|eukprot:XP_009828226.1 serine/threonine protein kinase, variant 1 [Aphanomyces astaci]